MNTLKTGSVVVMLLAVLYGVYTVLNRPEVHPPKEITWLKAKELASPEIEDGTAEGASEASADDRPSPARPFQRRSEKSDRESSEREESLRGSDAWTPGKFGRPTDTTEVPAFAPPPDLAPHTKAVEDNRAPAQPTRDPNARFTNAPPASSSYEGAKASAVQPAESDVGRASALELARAAPSAPSAADANAVPNVQVNPYVTDTKPGPAAGKPAGSHYGRNVNFEYAWQTAQTQVNNEQWREALLTLSQVYVDPKTTAVEKQKLIDLLDPLAAKVVYSTEHLVEPPHFVRKGDTLQSVADQYNIPWQLVQNINDIRSTNLLVPGTRLKVVRGPFRAHIDLASNELTLFCDRLYSGRFPIEIGNDPAPPPGEFEVRAKEAGHAYYGQDGQTLAPEDPRNPYGACWIDLGHELAVHGSPKTPGQRGPAGCISLSPKDADDIFGILSQGSKVSIRR